MGGSQKGLTEGIIKLKQTEVMIVNQDHMEQIEKLKKQIGQLPAGYISKKAIGGREYLYHQ